ncbi:protein SPIRAL1-like 5 [Primulina eburnea]|uniref:protein SPIRAL1-like 5 n=1 Tax=Primulina eburnea TaxID=1245227 RepID=UPI003C6C4745
MNDDQSCTANIPTHRINSPISSSIIIYKYRLGSPVLLLRLIIYNPRRFNSLIQKSIMKRGGSYGGGQSSLGYLFGTDDKKKNDAAPPSPGAVLPPYGIDIEVEKPQENLASPSSQNKANISNNYPRVQGQNSGNFITGRPSTKVKSAPGGDSSLGYLFGDKSGNVV